MITACCHIRVTNHMVLRKQHQNKLSSIEKKIQELEEWFKETDFELEINYEETIQQKDFFDIYQARKKELELLYVNWEELQ